MKKGQKKLYEWLRWRAAYTSELTVRATEPQTSAFAKEAIAGLIGSLLLEWHRAKP